MYRQIISDLGALQAELWSFAFFFIMLVFSVLSPKKAENRGAESIFILGILLNAFFNLPSELSTGKFIFGSIEKNTSQVIFMQFIHVFLLFLALIRHAEQKKAHSGDYLLLSGALFPLQILLSSRHLLLTFLALEALTFIGIVFVSQKNNKNTAEVGLKFFFNAGISSAFFAFGMSLIFSQENSLLYEKIALLSENILVQAGFLCILTGFAFKAGAFPFHTWLADMYAKTEIWVIFFISVAGKLAVLSNLTALLSHSSSGFRFMFVFASLSMLLGAVLGLQQTTLRRLSAYSSVAQTGFLLICTLHPAISEGVLLPYFAVYFTGNLGLLLLIYALEKSGNTSDLSNIAHLPRNLYYSLLSLLPVLSLAGLPLTLGFWGKMYLFLKIWEQYSASGEMSGYYFLLIIFAAISTATSLFFYLKIPYFYFVKRDFRSHEAKNINFWWMLLCIFVFVGIVLPFFMPWIFA